MKAKSLQDHQGSKAVGIWIRVSTEDQARGDSPEHHEKRARMYAEAKGWSVREVYHLEATSGKSVFGHTETKRMLQDIQQGHITGLIFSKLARVARNTKELLELADIFKEYGADLISLQELIDTSTAAGRVFYTMIAAFAQWEREEIAERVAASVPIRARLGKPLGGQAPFGFQWLDKKLIPHPDEAPVRKLMFELFLEHKRKKTVARLLNDQGYRTRSGAKFSDNTVDRLLRDPLAKGLRRANYSQSTGDKKHWVLKPESEWVYSETEPIVSEDLWKQCYSILDTQRKSSKKPSRKSVHLFSGVTYCACGGKMYIPSTNPKYTCVKCKNKITPSDLEAVFHEQLKAFFFSPDEAVRYLEATDHLLQEKQEMLNLRLKEKQRVKQEMDKIMRLYLDDKLSPEGFDREYRPLEHQHNQIGEQLPELQGEIDFLRISYLSSDQIFAESQDLYSRWQDLEQEEKRKIIENITERITIEKDQVVIDLCYLPSPSEIPATGRHNLKDSSPPQA